MPSVTVELSDLEYDAVTDFLVRPGSATIENYLVSVLRKSLGGLVESFKSRQSQQVLLDFEKLDYATLKAMAASSALADPAERLTALQAALEGAKGRLPQSPRS